MARFGKVVKTAGKVVIIPAKIANNLALHATADVAEYVLKNSSPWAWNKIPQGFKTAAAHHLLDQNSRTRQTLDSLVTVLGALAIADKVAGPDVAIYRGAFEFWANNRLLTAGLAVGVPAVAAEAYDFVKHNVSKAGKIVYGTAVATGVALLIASQYIGHPVGSKGVSGPEKPAVVEQKPLTQQDLVNYGSILLSQVQRSIGAVNEEQNKALQDYVNKVVDDYVTQRIAAGGYVTGNDLERLGQQISGQISSLESRIKAAQATSTPAPTATPQPPTPTPTAIFGSGILEGYLNLAGKHYVVPVSLLKPVVATDGQGLASLLTNGDASLLGKLTNGDNADNEFVQLNVSTTGVTALVQYGAGAGPKPIPLQQTNPLGLSRYLQEKLTPAQLSTIQPVTN